MAVFTAYEVLFRHAASARCRAEWNNTTKRQKQPGPAIFSFSNSQRWPHKQTSQPMNVHPRTVDIDTTPAASILVPRRRTHTHSATPKLLYLEHRRTHRDYHLYSYDAIFLRCCISGIATASPHTPTAHALRELFHKIRKGKTGG